MLFYIKQCFFSVCMEVSFQARIVRFHPPLPMRQKGDQLMMKGDLPQVPSVGRAPWAVCLSIWVLKRFYGDVMSVTGHAVQYTFGYVWYVHIVGIIKWYTISDDFVFCYDSKCSLEFRDSSWVSNIYCIGQWIKGVWRGCIAWTHQYAPIFCHSKHFETADFEASIIGAL